MAKSKFEILQNKVAQSYAKKGLPMKKAEQIGGSVAYKVGVKKYGKKVMAKKAIDGKKESEEEDMMDTEKESMKEDMKKKMKKPMNPLFKVMMKK